MDNSDDDSDGPERYYNDGVDVYYFGSEKLLQYHACFEQDALPRSGLTAHHGGYRIDTHHDG